MVVSELLGSILLHSETLSGERSGRRLMPVAAAWPRSWPTSALSCDLLHPQRLSKRESLHLVVEMHEQQLF